MLVDREGQAQPDSWRYLGSEVLPTYAPHTVLQPQQWDDYHMRFGQPAEGLWLSADQDPAQVLALLGHLTLIVIEFAKSRDGRGFTLARLLRERHGFTGDLRAAGPLLPDQFAMLLQCGFTSALVSPSVPAQRWQEAAATHRQARPRTLLQRLSQRSEA
ncbi:DUF934 domain-containing protein [Pseudomonas monteilii]|jgi:uncharacterized protein (DUF934 family)|uniref:DUF934 domain-containing protein n=2 Tax=Pseudomonas putida group TaxID=136845 RepID=A0AAE6V2G0_9PSED|nr:MULTISPECIES: DUF934 domain-containing protein [Pseudomonas]MBB3270275.1 uncharacterized protein (DUF934 family) [Pseudomonas sp. OG7]MBH3395100.1 DUF934 domain-containing protein [Pseudomonas monteilii]MBH3455816.1 DUF934 domain-containing protein [Pseudomonas monteilii]MCJ7853451.1 DUF934 domain-containing protein [Pseudomonas monteilii]MDD2123732.1 DUF934 domain-containing protein [Pseudomonas monteilii]